MTSYLCTIGALGLPLRRHTNMVWGHLVYHCDVIQMGCRVTRPTSVMSYLRGVGASVGAGKGGRRPHGLGGVALIDIHVLERVGREHDSPVGIRRGGLLEMDAFLR